MTTTIAATDATRTATKTSSNQHVNHQKQPAVETTATLTTPINSRQCRKKRKRQRKNNNNTESSPPGPKRATETHPILSAPVTGARRSPPPTEPCKAGGSTASGKRSSVRGGAQGCQPGAPVAASAFPRRCARRSCCIRLRVGSVVSLRVASSGRVGLALARACVRCAAACVRAHAHLTTAATTHTNDDDDDDDDDGRRTTDDARSATGDDDDDDDDNRRVAFAPSFAAGERTKQTGRSPCRHQSKRRRRRVACRQAGMHRAPCQPAAARVCD
jgi:hypothetical protein